MGYACPVCETPQRDGEHLANHLAFTAMLHTDEHEDWLDERVDDWGDRTPADLASAVTEHAIETEYDEVFEDTTGGHDHGHARDHAAGGARGDPARPDVTGGGAAGGAAEAVVDDAVESVIEEARELTESMYGLDEDDDAGGDGESGEDAEGGESGDDGDDPGSADAGRDDG